MAASQTPIATVATIDPLLTVADFGTEYASDGAADATVLYPRNEGQSVRLQLAIEELLDLKRASLPLLIDCLDDGRLTSIEYTGDRITKPMKVPVGYICLDMLMILARSFRSEVPDCSDDGLGSCMRDGFYFWPNDYLRCGDDRCYPRPWITVVQNNWRRLYGRKQLPFRLPVFK